MKLKSLRQAPLNTTLVGVLRGVADYFGIEGSDAALFGVSGHAFVINIHEELCPSGPYLWNRESFARLTRNLGIEISDLGFFSRESSPRARSRVEMELTAHLDAGRPCSLLNMENQLITGYDEVGFDTAQPWPGNTGFPPSRLTFGTWEELGEECHVNFFTFDRSEPTERTQRILDSLDYAVDLNTNPRRHTAEPYGMGPDAYRRLIGAVEGGHGWSHGLWWNATVWAECRSMASRYLDEIAHEYTEVAELAGEAAAHYASIAARLGRVGDKAVGGGERLELLHEVRDEEELCIGKIEQCASAIRSGRAVAVGP